MGKVRTYIKTFDIDGNYLSDFLDISDSVLSVGDVSLQIDDSDFEIGIIKNSSLKIKVQNNTGRFSKVGSANTIFASKRKDSIIRVTWDRRTSPLYCGFFYPGSEPLGNEIVVFEGVLNEITSAQDIKEQNIEFQVLGYESKLQEMEVPYASLNGTMDYEDIMLVCLDQVPFNSFTNVSASNINVGVNHIPDDISDLENRTVKEALSMILKLSSSVVYLDKDLNTIVSPRTASASVVKTFYGQASINGNENIINLNKYRDGVNRIRNYFTWDETSLLSSDSTSIDSYGVQKEQFDSRLIDKASSSKIQVILDYYRDDFRSPKIEFEILTPLDSSSLNLSILDRVVVDYPTVYTAFGDEVISRYGLAVYGEDRYPFGYFDLTIPTTLNFKVLGKKISVDKNTILYKLREI